MRRSSTHSTQAVASGGVSPSRSAGGYRPRAPRGRPQHGRGPRVEQASTRPSQGSTRPGAAQRRATPGRPPGAVGQDERHRRVGGGQRDRRRVQQEEVAAAAVVGEAGRHEHLPVDGAGEVEAGDHAVGLVHRALVPPVELEVADDLVAQVARAQQLAVDVAQALEVERTGAAHARTSSISWRPRPRGPGAPRTGCRSSRRRGR